MTLLFAALDAAGHIRFVGDVSRGLQSGCFCPSCGSPVIARHGRINAWHFAHVGGQERPECYVGAVNLIRHLAIEYLSRAGDVELPVCNLKIRGPIGFAHIVDSASWSPGVLARIQWDRDALKTEPAGRGETATGIPVTVFVDVGEGEGAASAIGIADSAVAVFTVRVPPLNEMRTREAAARYIAEEGFIHWRTVPADIEPIRTATTRVDATVLRAKRELAAAAQRLALGAGRRWAAIAKGQALGQGGATGTRHPPQAASSTDPRDAQLHGRAPGCSLTYYQLRDGSRWLRYARTDNTHTLVPMPGTANAGWEEALPPTVGVYDEGIEAYRLADVFSSMEAMSRLAAVVRTGRSIGDFITPQ